MCQKIMVPQAAAPIAGYLKRHSKARESVGMLRDRTWSAVVLSGSIRTLLGIPPADVRLKPGQTYVAPLCSVEEATAELPSAVFEAVVTRANRRPASVRR